MRAGRTKYMAWPSVFEVTVLVSWKCMRAAQNASDGRGMRTPVIVFLKWQYLFLGDAVKVCFFIHKALQVFNQRHGIVPTGCAKIKCIWNKKEELNYCSRHLRSQFSRFHSTDIQICHLAFVRESVDVTSEGETCSVSQPLVALMYCDLICPVAYYEDERLYPSQTRI